MTNEEQMALNEYLVLQSELSIAEKEQKRARNARAKVKKPADDTPLRTGQRGARTAGATGARAPSPWHCYRHGA